MIISNLGIVNLPNLKIIYQLHPLSPLSESSQRLRKASLPSPLDKERGNDYVREVERVVSGELSLSLTPLPLEFNLREF